MFRRSLYLTVFVSIILAFIAGQTLPRNNSEPNPEILYHAERTKLFRTLGKPAKYLIAGDSITSDVDWHELLGVSSVANRSTRGETTDGLLARIDTLQTVKPIVTFLLVGINDIARGDEPADIAKRYRQIVRALPGKVYMVSLHHCPFKWKVCDQLNPRIDAFNRLIEEIPEGNVVVVNYRDGYSYDGIHLGADGTASLAAELRKLISETDLVRAPLKMR